MKNHYEKIEQYLLGELKGAELKDFKEQLSSNANLPAEVELYRNMMNSISSRLQNEQREESFKHLLVKESKLHFNNTVQEKAKIIPISRKMWMFSIAAAAAILLLFIFIPSNETAPFEQFYIRPIAELTERSEIQPDFKEMETAFNNGDCETALPLFENYLQTNNDAEILLFEGTCHLDQNDFGKAETAFKNISEGETIFKNTGTWYLALTYLKQDNVAACKTYLNKIPEDASKYPEAQKLLRQL